MAALGQQGRAGERILDSSGVKERVLEVELQLERDRVAGHQLQRALEEGGACRIVAAGRGLSRCGGEAPVRSRPDRCLLRKPELAR